MKFFKNHPLFATLMALFTVVILGELWYGWVVRGRVQAAGQTMEQRIAEIERLQRLKPAPSADNVRAARDDLAQSADVLATMLRVLNVVGPDELDFFKEEPPTRDDAWFAIQQFAERITNEAKKSGVTLKPDERFGFTAHAHEGPEAEYIRYVYRQLRIVEYLLQKLFAARPKALIAVQREQPIAVAAATPPATGAAARPPAAPSSGSGSASGDIFVIDPQVSARTPGYVDTMAFRVVFSGHTTALRGFMNALAAPDIPLVVRSVEVTAESAAGASGSGASAVRPSPGPFGPAPATTGNAAANPAAIAVVADNHSVFTVTVELFDVEIRPPSLPAVAAVTPSR